MRTTDIKWSVAAILAALLITRWPLLPPILLNFDSVNFALALSKFNPALHRPQPPGYALFVDLTRLIHLFIDEVYLSLFFAGIVGAVVAVWFTWRLGTDMFGAVAGYAAGSLMLVHPSFWTEGILNPVRVWLAAGSVVVGYFAWWCWQREHPEPPRYWLAAWLALGLASGFRPGLVLYLFPLLALVGWRRRTSVTDWLLAGCCLAVGVLAWLVQTIIAVGGLPDYLNLLRSYLAEQSGSSSLVYGAKLGPAFTMLTRAVEWTLVGAGGWIWFVYRRRFPEALFFVVWSVPAFLFLIIIHSAEPGHVLPLVPPLCVLGGWVVAGLTPTQRVAAVLIPVALFLLPPRGPLRLSSVRAVWASEEKVRRALNSIRQAGIREVHVTDDALAGWRLVSYELPDVVVQVAPSGSNQIWRIRNSELIESSPFQPERLKGIHILDSEGIHSPR